MNKKNIFPKSKIQYRVPLKNKVGGFQEFKYIRIGDEGTQLCSNLKDKNGKLIYEGDIVKTKGTVFIVIWYKEEATFVLKEIMNDFWMFLITDFITKEIEVIGNIYENSELLEKQK